MTTNTMSAEMFNDVCEMKGKQKSMPMHLLNDNFVLLIIIKSQYKVY